MRRGLGGTCDPPCGRSAFGGCDLGGENPKTERAHSYWSLVNTYDAKGYSRKAHRFTKRQLNRAANAVADLLG